MRTKEAKTFTFQVKDFDDAQGIVRGYLSTFDNIDEMGDRVRPGSFKRTLQNKYEYKKKHNKRYLMPLLWQHKESEPIGGYIEAREDDTGLFVELEVDLDVQRGKEAYSSLKKGYVDRQSMGYETLKSEYVKIDGKTVRDLLEVRLWEGSIVTFPANPEAVVTDVKATNNMDKTTEDAMLAKSIQEYYMQQMCKDSMKDWGCVFLHILTRTVVDAVKGENPEQDMAQVLDDFKGIVLDKWLTQALECGLPQFLAENTETYSYADWRMFDYEYMSNQQQIQTKAGRVFSASNEQKLRDCSKGLHGIADDLDALMPSTDDEEEKARKAVPSPATHGSPSHPSNDTASEEEASLILLTLQQAQYQLSNI